MRLGIEGGRVAVRLGEGVRQRSTGQPVDLGEHVMRGVLVHLGERADAHAFLHPEHLEQGELQIAEIALVVTHVPRSNAVPTSGYSPVTTPYYRRVTRATQA